MVHWGLLAERSASNPVQCMGLLAEHSASNPAHWSGLQAERSDPNVPKCGVTRRTNVRFFGGVTRIRTFGFLTGLQVAGLLAERSDPKVRIRTGLLAERRSDPSYPRTACGLHPTHTAVGPTT